MVMMELLLTTDEGLSHVLKFIFLSVINNNLCNVQKFEIPFRAIVARLPEMTLSKEWKQVPIGKPLKITPCAKMMIFFRLFL